MSARRAGNPTSESILAALRAAGGAATRPDIALKTGLSPSTVTAHVRTMLRRGLVVETEPVLTGRRGHQPKIVRVADRDLVGVVALSHGEGLLTGPVRVSLNTSREVVSSRAAEPQEDPLEVGADPRSYRSHHDH